MMQFLMSRLQASAVSWSSFSACRNSRGLPKEPAVSTACHHARTLLGYVLGRYRGGPSYRKNHHPEEPRWACSAESQLKSQGDVLALERLFCGTLRTFVGIY